MLDAMRKRTGSLVVKLFIGLLALSFAVWGIEDVFLGSQDPTVAEVGSTAIRASTLQEEYGRALENLRRASGGQIDAEQARALGVVDRALDGLITRAVVTHEVATLGLFTPDNAVAAAITENASFQDDAGNFNRLIYQSILSQNRLGEKEYEELVREQLSQEQLLESLAAGLTVPQTAVDAVQRYRGERRVAEVAMVTTDIVGDAPEPDEAAISEYYAANENEFMAPEYRRVTVVALKPGDLLDEVEVDEERVREEYDFRIDSYTVPHRRDVARLVFDTEDQASEAFERLMAGESFFGVGTELTGQSESDIDLGMVVREDFPTEEIADAVFTLDVGRISAPLETPFGWYLLRINEDFPGNVTPFEEVADEIRAELKIDQASDAVYELGNRLEDERAGGASIEEAARVLGIDVTTIGPVDEGGMTPDGTPAENLPPIQEFLPTAFASAVDVETDLIETDGNTSFVLRVDAVTAPALRPLAEIRPDVIAAWQRTWREDQAKALAEDVATRVAAGETLAAVSEEADIVMVTTDPFARDGRNLTVQAGPNLVSAIFDLEVGGATEAVISGSGRYAIAVLKEILPAESGQNANVEELRGQMRRSVLGDVEIALNDSLRRKYGVQVNQSLVDNLFDVGTGSP